ncbi:MAG: hypothetical protein HOK21_00550 [Rhodospirillaceae bacterium]|nr:hypothetical protein [Rhodospirillaceae bacterium]MBT5522550.1 hypothetical protein [Rhodospirillaceae bacterium]MBT6983843.1 hypothetical protein [Rhodospirillaceae bacterium]MBT7288289.1 hypothetical protein [Rhodospirillaceae bacterium]MBT7977410.1 hypothetical protein [Rhodospirillaceae bacterium]
MPTWSLWPEADIQIVRNDTNSVMTNAVLAVVLSHSITEAYPVAAKTDPDNPILTPEEPEQFRPVSDAKQIWCALNFTQEACAIGR